MWSSWILASLLGSQASAYVLYNDLNLANVTCPPTPSPFPAATTFTAQTTLPDPFLYLDGKTRVKTPEEWYACRQPEILKFLQQYQYGYYPDHSKETVTATRSGKSVSISIAANSKTAKFSATINLPDGASESAKAPVVISIGGMDNAAYLKQGIAVVTFDYTSVSPDSNGKTGAFWALYNGQDIGVLTAWAWGFHRVLDALIQTAPEIDTKKVGVTGCSRLGKAALAAGLFDTRITLTMPMSSGVQGLGPYRYTTLSGQGENLENSKEGAGWWTNSVLATFKNQATRLPYDAHTIAAALAPRALIIDQGTGDQFTNSKGTSAVIYPAAKLVYDFLGVGPMIGMGVRSGGHCDMSGYTNILPYVLKQFKNKDMTRDYNDIKPYAVMPEAYPWASSVPKVVKKDLGSAPAPSAPVQSITIAALNTTTRRTNTTTTTATLTPLIPPIITPTITSTKLPDTIRSTLPPITAPRNSVTTTITPSLTFVFPTPRNRTSRPLSTSRPGTTLTTTTRWLNSTTTSLPINTDDLPPSMSTPRWVSPPPRPPPTPVPLPTTTATVPTTPTTPTPPESNEDEDGDWNFGDFDGEEGDSGFGNSGFDATDGNEDEEAEEQRMN